MNNKKIILAILIIIILAFGGYVIYFKKYSGMKLESKPAVEPQKINVSDKFKKTNPFDVKVNPYEGYKNPFTQ